MIWKTRPPTQFDLMGLTERCFQCLQERIHVFSNIYGIVIKNGHILGQKANPDKCERTEILQNVFSNHCAVRLEINKKKIAGLPI